MSLTLDLPTPINEELTQDSKREGISEREHAALLVCLASAFKQEAPHTPFQKAVRDFLSHRSLDADHVVSVFDELVHVCLEIHDIGKTEAKFQEKLLKRCRNDVVHQPVDESYDILLSDVSPTDTLVQAQGRLLREATSEKNADDPNERVRVLLT